MGREWTRHSDCVKRSPALIRKLSGFQGRLKDESDVAEQKREKEKKEKKNKEDKAGKEKDFQFVL